MSGETVATLGLLTKAAMSTPEAVHELSPMAVAVAVARSAFGNPGWVEPEAEVVLNERKTTDDEDARKKRSEAAKKAAAELKKRLEEQRKIREASAKELLELQNEYEKQLNDAVR